MGHVEDLVDERREAPGCLVDPFDVDPLLGRLDIEVEERLGVAADEGEWRPQFVTDGGDEPFAQLLQGRDGADVAQDRGRPAVAPPGRSGRGRRRRRRVAPGDADGHAGCPRTAVSR